MYEIRWHMKRPKMKRRKRTPTRVAGMQKTPSRRSLMAKLSRKMLVTERIERFKVSVMITSRLPTTASTKMRL